MEKMGTGEPWGFPSIKVRVSLLVQRVKTNAALAALADAIFALEKPVILVLQGGRPFAIPAYYREAAAVLSAVRMYMPLI